MDEAKLNTAIAGTESVLDLHLAVRNMVKEIKGTLLCFEVRNDEVIIRIAVGKFEPTINIGCKFVPRLAAAA